MKDYLLPIDSVMMCDHNWVLLVSRNLDRDVIADQFFKLAKKGAIV